MSSSNPPIEMTYYNNTNKKQLCKIDTTRNVPYLNPTSSNYLSVIRYDFNNDLFPVYVPRIRSNNDIMTIYDAAMENQGYSKLHTFNNTLGVDSTSLFIAIEDEISKEFATSFVNWVPVNINSNKPTLAESQDRAQVLSNDYYHSYNTLHLSSLVEAQFTEAANIVINPLSTSCLLVKDESGYSLLIQQGTLSSLDNFNISVSQELWELYPFPAVPHDFVEGMMTLTLKSPQEVQYNGDTYFQIPTQYRSSSFIPFRTISIKTSYLPIAPQLVSNNVQGNVNGESKQITDFICNTSSDPDQIYDIVSFVPNTNFFRPIPFINSNKLTKFECHFTMDTADGYSVPLYLKPNRYCSILIDVFSQE